MATSDSIQKPHKYRSPYDEWVHDDSLDSVACRLSVLLGCFFDRDDLSDVEKAQVAIAHRIIRDAHLVFNSRAIAERKAREVQHV